MMILQSKSESTIRKLLLVFLCTILLLAACQGQPVEKETQQFSERAVAQRNTGPGADHPGVMGMKNVYQVEPPHTLINARPDNDVNIMYNKTIAASNSELRRAIEVFDQAGNLVHGTLSIDHYRDFLSFCADEPYQPGQYTAKYESVLLEGGERTRAFEATWEVEGDPDPNQPPCHASELLVEAGLTYPHTPIATY